MKQNIINVLKYTWNNFRKIILLLLALNWGVGGFILGMVEKEYVTVGAMFMVLSFIPLMIVFLMERRNGI